MPKSNLQKPTPFQQKVYEACKQIPSGRFTTYKLLAQHIQSHPRAVGQALKRNPFAPVVPCHRVIASDYSLGVFYGEMQSNRKVLMLKDEGVEFENERPIIRCCRLPRMILANIYFVLLVPIQ